MDQCEAKAGGIHRGDRRGRLDRDKEPSGKGYSYHPRRGPTQAAIRLANTSPAASPPASVSGRATRARAFSKPSFHTALAGADSVPGHTCVNTNSQTSSSAGPRNEGGSVAEPVSNRRAREARPGRTTGDEGRGVDRIAGRVGADAAVGLKCTQGAGAVYSVAAGCKGLEGGDGGAGEGREGGSVRREMGLREKEKAAKEPSRRKTRIMRNGRGTSGNEVRSWNASAEAGNGRGRSEERWGYDEQTGRWREGREAATARKVRNMASGRER